MFKKVRRWWEGVYIEYENDPNSGVVIIGGDQRWHWSALIARGLVGFVFKEWKWIFSASIALAGLAIAYAKLT